MNNQLLVNIYLHIQLTALMLANDQCNNHIFLLGKQSKQSGQELHKQQETEKHKLERGAYQLRIR